MHGRVRELGQQFKVGLGGGGDKSQPGDIMGRLVSWRAVGVGCRGGPAMNDRVHVEQ